ncbi:MAG: hypothetical protein DI537_16125 [Stutzerimonas stutzeri]|nr:MAG: hypothetical protein DI537_16125 [Stutzerimonas stutzeri]
MTRKRSTWALLRLLLSTVFIAAAGIESAPPAYAQARLLRIDKPLPTELKDRVAGLLKKIRPADWEQAVTGSRVAWHASWSDVVLIRVEAGCAQRQCMTLIGRLTDQAINLELTILAGDMVWMHDVFFDLWGSSSAPPWIFRTEGDAGLVAISRQEGWVVSACSNCTDWGSREPDQISPPEPRAVAPAISSPKSFKEFSQDLDLLRTR